MIRNFKYRIYPTKGQKKTLLDTFDGCRNLYNVALQHRNDCYRSQRKSITYLQQANELPLIKEDFPKYKEIHSLVLQNVLKRVDLAFQGFFRRVKKSKDQCGFPRYKGRDRFKSICYIQSGFKITQEEKRIALSKIGFVKITMHRHIPDGAKIKTCTIKQEGNHWYCILSCDIPNAVKEKVVVRAVVGIDLGLTTFAVLSNGDEIANPKYLKQSEAKLNERQSEYSKNKTKEKKKQLVKLHRKVANQRHDFQHKTSKALVKRFDLIAYEALNVKGMMKDSKYNLNKYIGDASWGTFVAMLKYKAEDAGKYAIAINPKGTSQKCSRCGSVVKKDLYERVHSCPCGFVTSRDHNAAINILASGMDACKTEAPCFSLG